MFLCVEKMLEVFGFIVMTLVVKRKIYKIFNLSSIAWVKCTDYRKTKLDFLQQVRQVDAVMS